MNGGAFWNDQEKAKEVIQELKTLNAVLKRRHTSHDVANLKQFPGQNLKEQQPKVYMKENLEVTSWGSPNNYYEQGW